MQEIWKDVAGYEGLYQVSNLGNVKSLNYRNLKYPKILKTFDDCKRGYLKVGLHKNRKFKSYSVHRLVAETFIPNPNNYPCVNHKDEVKTNNCVDNLEWCTYAYNNSYGTTLIRQSISRSVPINQYDLDNNFIKRWASTKEASITLGIGSHGISDCLCRRGRKTAGGYIWRYAD